jgi:hypothetical protein
MSIPRPSKYVCFAYLYNYTGCSFVAGLFVGPHLSPFGQAAHATECIDKIRILNSVAFPRLGTSELEDPESNPTGHRGKLVVSNLGF